MIDPETDAEFQDAVNAAEGALALASARAYGLVTGGPEINEDRCEEILAAGAARGIYPAKDAIETFVSELAAA